MYDLLIYNSVKRKLIYSDRKKVNGNRKQVAWGQGLETDGLQKGQKEIFEVMEIFVILIVIVSHVLDIHQNSSVSFIYV